MIGGKKEWGNWVPDKCEERVYRGPALLDKELVFKYHSCPDMGVRYNLEANQLFEHPKDPMRDDSTLLLQFWRMPQDTKPKDMVQSFIDALESDYEKEHCLVSAYLGKEVAKGLKYVVTPDDAYLQKLSLTKGQKESCGEFGLRNWIQFFVFPEGSNSEVFYFVNAGQGPGFMNF